LESKNTGQSVLKQKIADDLKLSLKSGDKVKLATVRLLYSAIKYAEMAKRAKLADAKIANQSELTEAEMVRQSELSDAEIYSVINREIRQHQESIESYKNGNRPDLVAEEEAELVIIQTYLPAQASREEIVAAAKRIIAETGAAGQRDKGKVMPKLVAEFKGKADGRIINEVVSELLTQG